MNEHLSPLERLRTIGFQQVGSWWLDGEKPRCDITAHATAKNILYALVVDGDVTYIGKSVRTLRKRLYNYQNPGPRQSTSIRIHREIFQMLKGDRGVIVYALPDNGLLYYGGFHVNLAAGLEDSLIRSLKPLWNKAGL